MPAITSHRVNSAPRQSWLTELHRLLNHVEVLAAR